ncbi:hypothetical protein LEP1GSC050_0074 [Leptospira phage vB_LbrZ_5399-LE1]|uniref:Uncharacterized protein n=1 Tax=Leptospira inadai serovar Lyme TaxID=293084 RepID=A0ABX4YGE9_9LEPT|nr:hypothetical protein [Leptospira inadai]AGS80776.1 hypothetical protein LEP1GSC050_0074 [Leptospira phage vB_LbrZ_5399-LE1]AGS80820.1 hypothetical protein LEP1GSC047_0895 [Leptospira phage vB_LinZ_10-LE1]PNV74337.1 hypothetical protein BES34_014215 [Leptospira inadai serovar Lyme]
MDRHSIKTFENATPLILGKQSNRAIHDLLAELAIRCKEVHVFDCAIRFNVFAIAEAGRKSNSSFLHNIHLQRAFTPYQLLDSIGELLRAPAELTGSPLYFFLAPSKQFFDGDVKKDEREHLLAVLVKKFEAMHEKKIRFLISESLKIQDPLYLSYIEKLKISFGSIEAKTPRSELEENGKDNTALFLANRIDVTGI